ncbi:hypothetical protein R2083_03310 [Nitrosomonas sp. Is35]|uniref:hypothetical protein n=1 Tax=Nitrosomonas sp. Is35 TaxID=3080534 RepID=UPI00294B738D|nr:hypothetical protein [Nitrosomonas sp. Is35]MDV6346541.1 hypothetical protein [Nitrosomonas sp. Is35]
MDPITHALSGALLARAAAPAMAQRQREESALPQPLSPFHWKIIIRHDDNYHLANVSLLPFSHPQHNQTTWLLTRMAAAYIARLRKITGSSSSNSAAIRQK